MDVCGVTKSQAHLAITRKLNNESNTRKKKLKLSSAIETDDS